MITSGSAFLVSKQYGTFEIKIAGGKSTPPEAKAAVLDFLEAERASPSPVEQNIKLAESWLAQLTPEVEPARAEFQTPDMPAFNVLGKPPAMKTDDLLKGIGAGFKTSDKAPEKKK